MKIKNILGLLICSLYSFGAFGCPTDGTTIGTVNANIVGIEVKETCTLLFIENVATSLPAIDNGPFTAGRFAYIALDPTHPAYNSMLTIATMGFATGKKVYANVTSRLARVNNLSVSDVQNSNQ